MQKSTAGSVAAAVKGSCRSKQTCSHKASSMREDAALICYRVMLGKCKALQLLSHAAVDSLCTPCIDILLHRSWWLLDT